MQKPTRQRHLLAVILLIVVCFSYIDRVNVSILMVDTAFLQTMGIVNQSVQKGLLMTLFLIAYGVGNVVLSPLGDILGPRKAMSLSVVIWALSLCLGGIAGTMCIMLVSRVLLGLGEGMHFPMQSKFIKEWFPPAERGKANAVWQTGLAIAPALAMPFFTWLIASMGWRGSFFVLAAMSVIPLGFLWFLTTDTPKENPRINDAELRHIEDGLNREREAQGRQVVAKPGFRQSVSCFARNYEYWIIVLYYVMHCSVFWGAMTWLPSYLKEARGFSWAAMGALASLPWFLSTLAKICSGMLIDRLGRRAPVVLFGMVGVALGVYFGASSQNNLSSAIALTLGLGAIGFGGPAVWTLMQDVVPSQGISTAAGIMNGVSNGFSSLIPVVIGAFIALTGSYVGGLYCIVACAMVGAACMLVLTCRGR